MGVRSEKHIPSKRKERASLDASIAAYAAEHGNTAAQLDLDPELEAASLETWLDTGDAAPYTVQDILTKLGSLSDPEAVSSMARFGIKADKAFGVSVPELRKLARSIGKDHRLAQELWDTGLHEARELATMIADPKQVTEELMELWVNDIDSWDVCDHCCGNLWDKTPFAYRKAREWSRQQDEFVKRASFSLMAALAVHDKAASDDGFIKFLSIIKRESIDDRNFVKKAVNWALRQIGKRNRNLNRHAIEIARAIQKLDSKSARWIAADALRELTNEKVQSRIRT
jgi:3-methyladenine DNA glycosylase AlkD